MQFGVSSDAVCHLTCDHAAQEDSVRAIHFERSPGHVSRLAIVGVIPILVTILSSGCTKPPGTPSALEAKATQCMRDQDYSCAQENWQDYIQQRPDDAMAIASLGIADNKLDDNEAAITQFQKAINLGEGTYDLFSYYADSLAKLGKTDAAIDWNYKALAVVPSLVDVRGKLAELLVKKKRPFEALVLLASFDDHLRSIGYPQYFTAQRIAIESAMQQPNSKTLKKQSQIRLPETFGHFYAPVILGRSHVTAFMVDTGASVTAVNDDFLLDSKAEYRIVRPSVRMKTADGKIVRVRLLNIKTMKIGDFNLRDVSAVECQSCQLLLGQSTLSRFDLISSKVQGVEFLTMRPRNLAKSVTVE